MGDAIEMGFAVESNTIAVANALDNIAKSQLPYATAVALTRTAVDVRRAEQTEMRQVFDRPTPFSINAFEVTPATKSHLVAEVGQKFATATSKPKNWFEPQVFGGRRLAKGFESLLKAVGALPPGRIAVPGRDATLDAYGNMSRGQIVQVLADLKASRETVYNMTEHSRRRNKRPRHFLIYMKGVRLVVRREGKVLKTIMAFVTDAQYAARFDFFAVGEKTASVRFDDHFDKALEMAIRTAK